MMIIWLARIRMPHTPSVSLEHLRHEKQAAKFNGFKVALLIEDRPLPILAPLMLHFMSVVPPDWRFRFMGSIERVEHINQSMAICEHVATSKLDLTCIPSNMSTGSQEEISRFLTTLWLYEVVLRPAEWLLIFQTESILVSAIIDVLHNQRRVDGSDPEDVWLTERLGHRPGSKLANGAISQAFSGENHPGQEVTLDAAAVAAAAAEATSPSTNGAYVEGLDDWRSGYYEPLGYHTGLSGSALSGAIWGNAKRLQQQLEAGGASAKVIQIVSMPEVEWDEDARSGGMVRMPEVEWDEHASDEHASDEHASDEHASDEHASDGMRMPVRGCITPKPK
ncbi:hypothetical protein B0H63DRAFT_565901 [Podospora didyma]|uniref:Uncharacterized protein n=1 Tax=Podospora didyma TaxID=330526 RepID=A0AAE0JY10_9PEZI|nr:hypothetical protein B0H63DRAFT_565901 [Podospora didyma]